jgi:hypothetical protein
MNNIKIDWHNPEKTIIRYHFQHGWKWEDLESAFKEAGTMLDTVNHKVHVIMDFSESSMFVPQGAFTHARRFFANEPHANVAKTVLIGNRFIAKMDEMIKKFLPKGLNQWNLLFAASLEQAEQLLSDKQSEENSS